MSEADDAYANAEALIEQAIAKGATILDLDPTVNNQKTQALDRIPDSISRLDALETLDLRDTQVSDLQPISALTALEAAEVAPTDVAKLTTYVVDHDEEKLAVLTQHLVATFGDHLPAQTLVPVSRLALDGMLFEVDATAVILQDRPTNEN